MGTEITEKNEKQLKELGIMISTCRKIKGLSQKELAEKAGISRSLISVIEAPRLAYNFTLDVLLNIADALGVGAESLLKGDWQTILKE
ncbi:MAG TPA: helix-turn-helix domain-containing protein [Firmicutes bacterium]|jgi:transcriptional regulator, XRE family|nr:helix-turn-helix domain-containing protein [Bacillota bacterium]